MAIETKRHLAPGRSMAPLRALPPFAATRFQSVGDVWAAGDCIERRSSGGRFDVLVSSLKAPIEAFALKLKNL